MGNLAIVYASVHHKNTEKLVQAVAPALGAACLDCETEKPDVSGYDTLIFASGIFYHKLHKSLRAFIDGADLAGKKAVVLYTCGIRYKDYALAAQEQLASRGAEVLGNVWCRGWDTFGPFEKIGGIAKGHPNARDFTRVQRRLEKLLK